MNTKSMFGSKVRRTTQPLSMIVLFLLGASQAFGSGGSSSVGTGNPAARYCVEVGGRGEFVIDRRGNQMGLCVLDRAKIEEWTLFRASAGYKSMATNAYLVYKSVEASRKPGDSIGMPNPASANCVQVGGQLEIYSLPGGQMGMCHFSDNSSIEEWTLFNGPSAAGNEMLTRILLGG